MSLGQQTLLGLLLFGFMLQVESGELLGSISDDTAAPSVEKAPSTDKKTKIIYRVICPANTEMLPECEQPPVNDVFESVDTEQRQVETAERSATALPTDNLSTEAETTDIPLGKHKSKLSNKHSNSKRKAIHDHAAKSKAKHLGNKHSFAKRNLGGSH